MHLLKYNFIMICSILSRSFKTLIHSCKTIIYEIIFGRRPIKLLIFGICLTLEIPCFTFCLQFVFKQVILGIKISTYALLLNMENGKPDALFIILSVFSNYWRRPITTATPLTFWLNNTPGHFIRPTSTILMTTSASVTTQDFPKWTWALNWCSRTCST